MDFNEIRQAIDDVIKENGDNKITAKSLNLLLNNLVDVMETNARLGNTNIMVCLGDTYRVGEAEPTGDIPGYITVTKEENLQRNIDAYNKIKEYSENDIPFNIVLDFNQCAKMLSSAYPVYNIFTSMVIGIDTKIAGDVFNDDIIKYGYDPTIYSGKLLYQIFRVDNNYDNSIILCPDGVIIGMRV